MIRPDGLLDHARRLAGEGEGRPPDADLRRGVSAAYYAAFHEMTERAAGHLIGSATEAERNRIRRSWSHGEIASLATMIVERAKARGANPATPLTKEARRWGPLVDLAAADSFAVAALRLFGELQEQRHRADYDHDAEFDKVTLLTACQTAATVRTLLAAASASAREALWTLLAVRRSDFADR